MDGVYDLGGLYVDIQVFGDGLGIVVLLVVLLLVTVEILGSSCPGLR